MFKFLHTADIHLDSPLRGLERYEGAPVDQIRGATRQALKNLVRLAIEEEVQFVLIVGDLYDGEWKDYNTALFLAAEMSKLKEAGIRVFIVAGNHDAASNISKSLSMPENVKRLSTKKPESVRLEDIHVVIHGQGFHQRAVTENLSSFYPEAIADYFNIGMLHTSVTGREGHENYAPCKVEDLLSKNYAYWALGHVHKREVLHEDPWIIFPGNIQGRHIGEAGPKGCTIVTVENSKVTSVTQHDLDVVRWVNLQVDAQGAELPEEIVDKVRSLIEHEISRNENRLLACRVSVHGSCKAHMELSIHSHKWVNEIRAMATDASDQSVWIEKVNLQTNLPLNLEDIMKNESPLGELLRFIQAIESPDQLPSSLMDDYKLLKGKLPADIIQGENALDIESPEKLREIIGDVKQLLTARLLSGGATQ